MKNNFFIFHIYLIKIIFVALLLNLLFWLLLPNGLAQCNNPFDILKKTINSDYQTPIFSNNNQLVEIFANTTSGIKQKNWQAQGKVVIHHQENTIYTDRAYGDIIKNQISMPSTFYISNPNHILKFAHGIYNQNNQFIETGSGKFVTKPFIYKDNYSGLISNRGFSKRLSFSGDFDLYTTVNPNQDDFENVVLTTCPQDNPEWSIKASSLSAYHDRKIGVARNLVLRVGGLPVFYLPWIDFPLDGRRKSGFLLPKIEFVNLDGQDRILFTQPYYFNLAPNYDWLLSPKFFKGRGILFNNSIRYLTKNNNGNIYINIIDNDRKYHAISNNDYRRYRLYNYHHGIINKYFSYSLLGNKVSDNQYLREYGDQVYSNSAINLPNNIELKGKYKNWQASLGYYDYQNLSSNPTNNKPYIRAPAFFFNSPTYQLSDPKSNWQSIYGNVYTSIAGELTNFTHNQKTNIRRTWIYPKLRWQLNDIGGFASWQFGTHISYYRQINPQNYEKSSITRLLPIIKTGGGLFFEREHNQKKQIYQTLEPRIYWLYIPYKQQSQFPIIDTSKPSFQLSNLDVDNLFSGWDRISDANVLTFGLTSRFLQKDRGEFLNFNLGQRYHLDRSRVTLNDQESEQPYLSDFLFSANALLDKWRIESSWRYNQKTNKTSRTEGLISYQPKNDRLIGVRYLYQANESLPRITSLQKDILSKVNLHEILEGAIDWPLNQYLKTNISFSGRNYYSLADKKFIETRLGLRYYSCCMGISIYRTNILIDQNQFNQTWGIEFNLLGLGKWTSKSANKLDSAVSRFRVR